MAVKPTPPGTAYRTNKDLAATLFSSFPRADDGSQAELPDKIADTIVPTINLADPLTLSINSLVIERIQLVALAPAGITGFIVVPANERWIVWRVICGHSDLINHIIFGGLSAGGVTLAIGKSESLAANEQWYARGPFVANPTQSFAGQVFPALGAGAVSIDVVLTRFSLTDQIPQTETIF